MAVDLKNEYPDRKGFSVRNMQFMMQFYYEYNKELTIPKSCQPSITKLPVSQLSESNPNACSLNTKLSVSQSQSGSLNFVLPIKHVQWTHNIILIQKVKDIKARYWYMMQYITGNWTKDYLIETIKLDYYGKHGALANNFDVTLPLSEAGEIKSVLKDPYVFDMLTFTDQYNERDVEIGLVKHIEKFLVRWGLVSPLWDGSII